MLLSADTINIFFISEPDTVHHRSRVETDSTSFKRQASLYSLCIMTSVLRQASKKYLTDSHIFLKYFELIFLQLHMVKISCKSIIT